MDTEITCDDCKGLGYFSRDSDGASAESCRACHGSGVRETAEVIAAVEARVERSTKIEPCSSCNILPALYAGWCWRCDAMFRPSREPVEITKTSKTCLQLNTRSGSADGSTTGEKS